MKTKRLLALVASAALMLSVFTACNNGDSGSTSGEGTGNEPITLVHSYWDNPESSEDLMTQLYGKGLKEFNEGIGKENNVTMEWLHINSSDYGTKITAMGVANQMPDTLHQQPGAKTKEMGEQGFIMDMKQFLDADPEWADTFLDGMGDQVTFDGKQYAIPIQFAVSAVFYNTELFDQAGVKADEIKTWDDFLDACQTLKDAGITPLVLPGEANSGWAISLFTGQLVQRIGGEEIFDPIRNLEADSTFMQDAFLKAGELTMQLVEKGYVQDTYMGDSVDMNYATFKTGGAAMQCQGSWAIGTYNGDGSEVVGKVSVFPFPEVEGGKGDSSKWMGKTDNVTISKNCKDVDRALLWIKFLSGEDFQRWTVEEAGKFPTTNVEYDPAKCASEVQAVLDISGGSTGVYPYIDEALGNTFGTEWNSCLSAFFTGAKTVEAAFQDLQAYNESMKAKGGSEEAAE